MKAFWRGLLQETKLLVLELFRILIPVILIMKALEELGAVEWLSRLLGPLMAVVGLPDSLGIVWATAMLVNLHAGLVVFFNLAAGEALSVAQVTVLGVMMLVAHSLPIEIRVAQKSGVRPGYMLLLRIGGALLLGGLLFQLYRATDWLQQPVDLPWRPEAGDGSLTAWAVDQLQMLGLILLVVFALLLLLRILRLIRVEQLLVRLLQPLLRALGIGAEATTLTIVGMTLGIVYGAGLLIREAQAGHVSSRDVLASMSLLGLCHSIIEDTLLIALLGADLSGILWARILFSLLLVALLGRWIAGRKPAFLRRFLVYPR